MMDNNKKTDLEDIIDEKAEEIEAVNTLTTESDFSHEEAEGFIAGVRLIGTAGSTIGNHPIDVLDPIIPSVSEDGEESNLEKVDDNIRSYETGDNLKRDEENEVCEIVRINDTYNVDSSNIDSSFYDEDQSTIDYTTVILADDNEITDNCIATNVMVTILDDGSVTYNTIDDDSEESFKSFQERPSIVITEDED